MLVKECRTVLGKELVLILSRWQHYAKVEMTER